MFRVAQREGHHLEGAFDLRRGRRGPPDSLAIPRQSQGSASHAKNERVPHPRRHVRRIGFPSDAMVSFVLESTSGRVLA
jgi:hypothetical protein